MQVNSDYLNSIRQNLASHKVCLYDAALNSYHFCHHPALGVFKGKLYAMWSNGPTGEDEFGQRVLYSISKDGNSWSAPEILCPPLPGPNMTYVMTAAGFHTDGKKLVAYVGAYEYEYPQQTVISKSGESRLGAKCSNTTCFALVSDDGGTFGDPIDLKLPLCPNYGPKSLLSGRLLMTGNWAHAYTDDPSGLTGWVLSGFCPDAVLPSLPKRDDPSYFWEVSKNLGLPHALCEGSFIQDAEGAIHMMHRSYSNALYQSDSFDNAESWSMPEATGFPNGNSKFYFDRLPDGRSCYIGNPGPDSKRRPLVVSINENNALFSKHYVLEDREVLRKFPGCYKGGMYAYPHAVAHGDHMYVIYSVWKEDIYVAKIPLCQL